MYDVMTEIPLGEERREEEKEDSCDLTGWGMFNCE